MKFLFFFITLVFGIQLSAQDADIPSKIDFFNSKIQQTEKGERLIWMDSLNHLVWEKTEFKYDSIARKTINYAIQLDSLDYASRKLSDLVYYHNNVVNQPREGILLLFGRFTELKK